MYISPKKHILSDTILLVAFIRLGCTIMSGVIRLLLRRGGFMPDMSDAVIWNVQTFFSFLMLILSAAAFIRAMRTVVRCIEIVPEEDRMEMAILQRDLLGDENSALPAEVIHKLLSIWLTILVGAQLMYDFFSEIYRRFTDDLAYILTDSAASSFVNIYNLTHSFKYQGMVIAILLGALMTAIFLNDRMLKVAALSLALIFVLSAAGLEMFTLSLLGRNYGIVWSSVIYHIMDTVGLIILAIYLRKRYHGV